MERWAGHFGDWYPEESGGSPPAAGLKALLAAEMDPGEYERLTKRWRLRDLLVWMEEARVHKAFDDLRNPDQ